MTTRLLEHDEVLRKSAANKAAWNKATTAVHTGTDGIDYVVKSKPVKPSKYRNKKIERNGLTFDSRRELKEWVALESLQHAGVITDLQRQVKYVLIPSQTREDGTKERPVTWTADFVYKRDGKTVVADAKGIRTQQGIIRRKLMLMVHGITVKEV